VKNKTYYESYNKKEMDKRNQHPFINKMKHNLTILVIPLFVQMSTLHAADPLSKKPNIVVIRAGWR